MTQDNLTSALSGQSYLTSPLSGEASGLSQPSLSSIPPHEAANAPVFAQTSSSEALYNEVVARVNADPNAAVLRASLAERLIDDNGKVAQTDADVALKDVIHPEQHARSELVVSKWSHPSVGANSVVTFRDTDTGDLYVLMAQKYINAQHPELGLSNVLEVPGGHMEAKSAVGATNPLSSYDYNLATTATRELKEETGLALSDKLATSLGTLSDDKRVIDNPRQGIEENYHFHLEGKLKDLPPVHGSDDVAASFWVKMDDITANRGIGRQDRDSGQWRYHFKDATGKDFAIRDDLGEAIDVASQRLGAPLHETQPSPMIGAGQVSQQARSNDFVR